MNKKTVIIDFLFVLFLSLIVLVTSFSISFVISSNEARDTLKTYGSNIVLNLEENNDFNVIEDKYSEILNLRVTIFNKDADVLLEINNDDKVAANEDRYNELVSNVNNYYYKDSMTMNYSVLYYVTEADNYFVRVGLPRSTIESTSFYILIIGTIILALIVLLYGFLKYRYYKKGLLVLKNNVKELENIAGLDYDLSTDDGYKIIDQTLTKTSNVIKSQVENFKSEKRKTDYILDSIEEGFIVLDGEQNCILINKFALDKLNLEKENILNKSFHNLALGDELNNAVLQAFSKNSFVFDKEIGGKIYEFLLTKINLSWIKTSSENAIGIVFFDVTQERLNEKIRREFFQNASHELKTPLTTIIGYEEMIENGMIEEKDELKRAREAIIKESKRMESVIEDMLALSSLEYRMSNEKAVEFDASVALKDIVNSLEYLISEKDITCNVKVSKVNLKMVLKDYDRLVRNLLSNAIKYNKERGGKIWVKLTKNYLSVKDNGIGIDEKDQARIFERFYRVDKGRSREAGGTGLGLAIVKHICLNYGFKIEIKSKLMEGSEFIVYFAQEDESK